MKRTDYYFALWGPVLPVSSVLVVPSIQGTTPAYLLALCLLLPMVNALVLAPLEARRFYANLGAVCLVFLTLCAIAQLALTFSGIRNLWEVQLVDPFDDNVLLRRTMFTQSLYLLAAASTFVFVKQFYTVKWDRVFLAGAGFLALYGIYEVCYFLVFHSNGDFLSNRTFGRGLRTGSWFQLINLGPIVTQRLKSLTGEPSMYAFTMLPFWIYSVHTERRLLQWILLASLILTTSTTAFVGIAMYLAMRLLRYGVLDRLCAVALIGVVILLVLGLLGNHLVVDAYQKLVASRLRLADASSADRFRHFMYSLKYFAHAPVANQLFGLSFGYARPTNMFTTILVNMGVVGLLVVIWIFARPVMKLGWDERSFAIKAGLVVIFITMMLAVPEFSYLSTWLFLGIAYNELAKANTRERRDKQSPGGNGYSEGGDMGTGTALTAACVSDFETPLLWQMVTSSLVVFKSLVVSAVGAN